MGYLYFLCVIYLGELLFHLVFHQIRKYVLRDTKWVENAKKLNNREIVKGVLERTLLAFGIAHGIVTVIVAFAAFKVATKLGFNVTEHNKTEVENHNDYFLLGNMLSLLFALAYALIAVGAGFITFRM